MPSEPQVFETNAAGERRFILATEAATMFTGFNETAGICGDGAKRLKREIKERDLFHRPDLMRCLRLMQTAAETFRDAANMMLEAGGADARKLKRLTGRARNSIDSANDIFNRYFQEKK